MGREGCYECIKQLDTNDMLVDNHILHITGIGDCRKATDFPCRQYTGRLSRSLER